MNICFNEVIILSLFFTVPHTFSCQMNCAFYGWVHASTRCSTVFIVGWRRVYMTTTLVVYMNWEDKIYFKMYSILRFDCWKDFIEILNLKKKCLKSNYVVAVLPFATTDFGHPQQIWTVLNHSIFRIELSLECQKLVRKRQINCALVCDVHTLKLYFSCRFGLMPKQCV